MTGLYAWVRQHPEAARNLLFLLIGVPLAALARLVADHWSAWLTPAEAALAPAPAIIIALGAAKLLARRF